MVDSRIKTHPHFALKPVNAIKLPATTTTSTFAVEDTVHALHDQQRDRPESWLSMSRSVAHSPEACGYLLSALRLNEEAEAHYQTSSRVVMGNSGNAHCARPAGADGETSPPL